MAAGCIWKRLCDVEPRRLLVAVLLAAVLCGRAAAADEKNIYSGPDLVVLYPVEGTGIFATVVLGASLVEFLIAYLMGIDNDYFQLVYKCVAEETIVCSLLTLVMIFAKSLGTLQPKWVMMLNYAVLSLFFMVVFFVGIIGSVVIVLHLRMKRWHAFEESTRIDVDPKLSSHELLYKQCRDRFRESIVGKDLKYIPDMKFHGYMQRMERFTVAEITDLSWKSWVALAVIVVVNGVRARITTGTGGNTVLTTTDRSINVASYIGFVGYGALALYVVTHYLLYFRLRAFASTPAAKVNELTHQIELLSSRRLLYFADFRTTAQVFQCSVLILEWYLAVFVLGMGFEVYRTYAYVSIVIFAAAVLPLLTFVYMFPTTITTITILNSLGEDLNVTEVQAVLDAHARQEAAASGVLDNNAGADGSAPVIHGAAPPAASHTHAGEPDEWNGEQVTLHDKSSNRLLDLYVPTLNVRADHPNARPRAAFEGRAPRPALGVAAASASLNASALPTRDQRYYNEGLDLPPPAQPPRLQPPRRTADALPTGRWIDVNVSLSPTAPLPRPTAGPAIMREDPFAEFSKQLEL
jgi:hypothetical protein